MTKVLIAEDEQEARESLVRIFTRNGHDVRSAATGQQAVDVGCSFRPDVLLADWMLKNHINGLHVSQVLRAVDGNLATILISGFPPQMFAKQRLGADVPEFFEKPLDVARLLATVTVRASAPQGGPFAARAADPGILETSHTGDIVHANGRAAELYGRVVPGRQITNTREIFTPTAVAAFSDQRMSRIQISYASGETTYWRICVRNLTESPNKLLVILPEENLQHIDLPLVRMLLGFPEPWQVAWPLQGMTLVVETDTGSGRVILAQLRRARAKHLRVSSAGEALQAMTDHPQVDLVIVDHALGVNSIRALLLAVDAHHRGAIVIGAASSAADDERLQAARVTNTLRKPFSVDDLLDIVTGRL